MATRVLVFLVARWVPDLFVHVGGTHVHHLNYGIFLLSDVGGWLLFARPAGRALSTAALLYAVGLALIFDEFGMWLHLGGGYWQRASAPTWSRMQPRHWWMDAFLLALTVLFFAMLAGSLHDAEQRAHLRLERLERSGPP